MCSLQVEYYEIGEIGAMLIFSAENEKFITLIQRGSVAFSDLVTTFPSKGHGLILSLTHSDARNVTIVINWSCSLVYLVWQL